MALRGKGREGGSGASGGHRRGGRGVGEGKGGCGGGARRWRVEVQCGADGRWSQQQR